MGAMARNRPAGRGGHDLAGIAAAGRGIPHPSTDPFPGTEKGGTGPPGRYRP